MSQTRIAARISQLLAVLAALAVTLVVYVGSTGPLRAQGAIGPTATVAAATIYSYDAPTTTTTAAGNVRGATLHSLAPSTQVRHLLTSAQVSVLAAKTGSTAARATLHGSERLTQAGFTDDLIAQTRAGLATRQSDGANVFVREVTPGRFDFIVEGERGVVTAHRGWSQKSVDRLAKNYSWDGWPP